jgi:hypothetical protein
MTDPIDRADALEQRAAQEHDAEIAEAILRLADEYRAEVGAADEWRWTA